MSTMPRRSAHGVNVEGTGHALRDRRECGLPVQLAPAAPERVGAYPAKHHVRVGDRRFRSPSAVTDGAGHGPGAVRADVQFAELVHGSDAAASRPYRSDLYRWDTEPVAFNHGLAGEARLAIHDESNIEARASPCQCISRSAHREQRRIVARP